ncbi:MAG: FKBP-type peptidyl-prolyl cis-trans isomerase, partial [Planctomycetes bacterium]|nr:FKBP-type peptidyl-prolyl cis-trans isomerase [Planctomycetota bacterium]
MHKLPDAHRHSPKIVKLFKDASNTATVPGRGKAIAAEETKSHRTGDGLRVSNDKVVSIEYTLKLADNTVQDSNVGKDPLRFVYGSNDIIP